MSKVTCAVYVKHDGYNAYWPKGLLATADDVAEIVATLAGAENLRVEFRRIAGYQGEFWRWRPHRELVLLDIQRWQKRLLAEDALAR